jgi:cytoskeleton protein RodZ
VTVGLSLRNARVNAKFSIQKVSDETRIRVNVITDLENDKFDSSGGIAYARGHIRTIAKLVGADADALIAEMETTTGEIDRPMIDLLSENFATSIPRETPRVSYKTMSMVAAVVVGALIIVPAVSSMMSHSTAKKSTAVVALSQTPTPSSATTAPPVIDPLVATKSSGVIVIVTASTGTTWLGVTDSTGAQQFSGRLGKGQTHTFTENQLLRLVIGNAGAVNLTVNGQNIGSPGAIGEVVHLEFGPGAPSQG